jgi:hypothetical protein
VGLLGLVAMDAVEVHPWNATVDDLEHPDRLVFDLDPGDGVAWDFVVETAMKMRDLLKAIASHWLCHDNQKGQGCTDQACDVKKVLANSEPSTHGTSATCRSARPNV